MIDFKNTMQHQIYQKEICFFKTRDGSSLPYRFYPSESPYVFILLHGSAGHSQYLSLLGENLAKSGLASVYTPDMRGHGHSPERRGDISYIGQLEDDIEDLIFEIRNKNSCSKIIVGGHSSGGGFALRFSRSPQAKNVDCFVLIAPFLSYNAPTTRQKGVDWAIPFLSRMIGLEILNGFGVTMFNGMPVIRFNVPQELCNGMETKQYSYRLYKNFHPAHYESDLKLLEKPLLVLVGDKDEVFFSEQYSKTILPLKKDAEVFVLKNCTHMDIVMSDLVLKKIECFIKKMKN